MAVYLIYMKQELIKKKNQKGREILSLYAIFSVPTQN